MHLRISRSVQEEGKGFMIADDDCSKYADLLCEPYCEPLEKGVPALRQSTYTLIYFTSLPIQTVLTLFLLKRMFQESCQLSSYFLFLSTLFLLSIRRRNIIIPTYTRILQYDSIHLRLIISRSLGISTQLYYYYYLLGGQIQDFFKYFKSIRAASLLL
jgi:hypothetical protein